MSRPSEILCFCAGIRSCWTFAPRSRLKRWHVCVVPLCRPLLCSSLLPYSRPLWSRCALPPTLLSSKPYTLLGSPRGPRRCRVRPHLLRLLLTVGAALLLFLGLSSLRSRPLLRPPPPGGVRIRAVRVRLPFPRPPAALAGPVASERGPGSGQRDVLAAPLWVGACLVPHWRRWQAIGSESWLVSVLRD